MAEISRLPGPVADLWDWQLRGACREADPTLFFHPEGERGPARRNRDAAAKAICAACPVIAQCREHALAVREPYGVWGGLTEDEREAVYATERRAACRWRSDRSPASTTGHTTPGPRTRRGPTPVRGRASCLLVWRGLSGCGSRRLSARGRDRGRCPSSLALLLLDDERPRW